MPKKNGHRNLLIVGCEDRDSNQDMAVTFEISYQDDKLTCVRTERPGTFSEFIEDAIHEYQGTIYIMPNPVIG